MFASKDLFFSKPSGYQISRSVRLRSSASAYFNRTPAGAGSRTTWTWSAWVKRGALGAVQYMFSGGTGTTDTTAMGIRFGSDDALRLTSYTTDYRISSALFRDVSAWYHVIVAFDTTQATAANRIKMYVNGVQLTSFSTSADPVQNTSYGINQADSHSIGRWNQGATSYTDGYLTEVNFIDGQALTPSSFGETNTTTGVWQPKKYTGTYGTNGFYLNFSDNSGATATTIGKDYSGNGNNWTPNNISVTAGVTYDSMLDVPTLFADGGNGRGNYATWNPLGDSVGNAPITLSNANLTATNGAASYLGALGTIALPSSGKYYWEGQLTSTSSGSNIWTFGIAPSNIPLTGNQTNFSGSSSWYIGSNEQIQPGGVATSAVAGTTSDVYQICFDAATGNVFLGKNNTFYSSTGAATGNPATGANPSRTLTAGDFGLIPWTFGYAIGGNVNFGQRPFTYTPPTGFVALNTQNLPTPTISNGANYMAATTYTGTGSALTIANTVNGISFQPDFVWVKGRSGATDHALYDSVRGVQKQVESNTITAETTETTGLTAFGSTGFTVGALAQMNTNAATYVGWQWNAGGSTVTNTSGSISAQVRANPTAGFSVVTYTGTGANATVGHGLGVAPSMVIVKRRDAGGYSWIVGMTVLGWNNYMVLNQTIAAGPAPTVWNSTAPTSNVFSVGTDTFVNASGGTYVAYCFSEVAGYSKFGSYTGNGSADGPFVFTNFQPRFVMFKRTDTTGDWIILDGTRNTFNAETKLLYPNLSDAEVDVGAILDFTSNGFKLRFAGGASVNASGGTYIFAAFASNPLKYSLAR